jgi:hypothetical protein
VDENGDPIESDEEEEEEAKEVVPDRKKNTRLCSECSSRVAIRACVECGDKFCTKCYKHLHSTGKDINYTHGCTLGLWDQSAMRGPKALQRLCASDMDASLFQS